MVNKKDMNVDEIVDNRNDIKILGATDPLTSSSNLQTQKNCLNDQEEESSSGSSPSTLKKRLQELPSTARSIDRTSLGNRIYNREVCHRSDSAKNYVEVKQNKEERNKEERNKEERNKIVSDTDEASSISSPQRSYGARARRRAKIRSEILEEIDKSLAATRSSLNDFLSLIDKSDEERKSTGRSITDSIESLESSKIDELKDSSMLRRRSAFITDQLTSRSYYRDGDDDERHLVPRRSKSAKEDRNSYDCTDNVKTSDRLFKNRIELRPLKFGGYRPHTGIILNNLSSDSEMDCSQDRNHFMQRKISSPVVNTELSTPVSNVCKLEEGIETLPVLSARNDDDHALLSFRSVEEIPKSRISVKRCNTIKDNLDTFTPYLEENLNNGDGVRKNDVNLLINKETGNHESSEINFENERRENSYRISEEMIRLSRNVSSKSADDLTTLPKRPKEQYFRLGSAKYYSHKETSMSTTRIDGRSSGQSSSDYQREKTPSFLNVKLIEDLEALDASDNENNINTVPILPLYSANVSRSTSPGSKICTQNCSPNRNLIDTRDKESISIGFQHRFGYDNENIETFQDESSDKICMSNKTWQVPTSIESGNFLPSNEESDVLGQSRRAYSAPCPKLSNENIENARIDTREDDSKVTSNLRGYNCNEIRCKSADISRQGIFSKENLTRLEDSPYSSHFARSTGSLSYGEDYQTLSDPLEMSYSRDEEFDSSAIDYGISWMYPRQSHLSVLQEESETRFEENGRSETTIENKDSNKNNVNKIDEIEKVSTISSKDRNHIEVTIEEKQTLESVQTKDQTDDNESNDGNQNCHENSDNSYGSTRNDSLSGTQESYANSTSPSSRSVNSESSNEDDNVKNSRAQGDNEIQPYESYDGTIDVNESRSKKICDKSNDSESMSLEDKWLISNESSKLQYLTSVQPEGTKLVVQKVHETRTVPKNTCSTLEIRRASDGTKDSPRFRNKKSQDRFPFTISETRSMVSTSHKKQGHCENVNNKTRSLETFESSTDPVFKEFLREQTVDCFNYGERQEQRNLVPRVKGLVRKLSKKFQRSRKRQELDINDPTTKVIYQNKECQVDSMPYSSSDDSSIKESKWMDSRSTKGMSSVISSGRSLRKSNSFENLAASSEYPRRRYDRDDLWVRELQKCLPTGEIVRTSSKERFSLFASKSSGSSLLEDSKRTPEKSERTSCKKEEEIKIPESCSPLASNVIESNVTPKNERNPEADESSDDVESGCVCLKIFRTMTRSLFARSTVDTSIESRQRSKR